MSNDIFDGQILAEKLSKLNNTQQSIESLSRWCIPHQKRAKDIVEIWDKLFNASQKEQRVSFLNLANDILQNSRRKGIEFVNEFWKVLPAALRCVYESGDVHGRKAVNRLIDVWEERKVFGSRSQGLKDELMSKNPLPCPPASNGKGSDSIKIVKRDAHSVRIKLAVGCLPEKILTAFHSVLDEHLNEEAALNNCNAGVQNMVKLLGEVENTLAQGSQPGSTLANELQEREKELKQYMEQLENAEAARNSLLSQLKDALHEQESKQELVRTQLLVVRSQIEKTTGIRKWLNQTTEAAHPSAQLNSTASEPTFAQPSMSFPPFQTSEEDNKKAAAAVAAKLAASSSSAQMLASVLSSLVAEEAASNNGSFNSKGFTSGLPMFNPEKRPKIERLSPVSDVNNSDMASSSFFTNMQQPLPTNPQHAPSANMQTMSQANQLQPAFVSAPLPPQYVQSTSFMDGGMPYGYMSNNLPPPPPFPPHAASGLSMPSTQPAQQSPPGGFYRPHGIGFYGQNHPSTPPPVHRH
ncbi:uncharacterized protein LOC131623683 [Vicia villosa]|uniref:uncharacterized protein LOC131623683 n=1 Tax=Vicia villosa TaxID=3911 RepID=UPI00273C2B3F|nr:uncharacterized protein LOC131623683 [Vicia villosa]